MAADLTLEAEIIFAQQNIKAQARQAAKSMNVALGSTAKSADALSQPLGRITGKADEFTKSMEAANARVLAFGASVGVLGAVIKGFKALVVTTIEVEKQMTSINTIMGGSASELDNFSKKIFEVARNTGQSFEVVSTAALELSRQGLKSEVVLKRLNDALILSRLTGQGAAEAVSGLTAAINSFKESGLSSADVLNKLSAAAISAAVSEKDLIEGVKRSGAVAVQAGVSFDELVGVIGAVQEKTSRGGAVIGNSFKTIFTRLQSLEKLETMQKLGVEVTDASGAVLSATQLIKNLGKTLKELPKATQLQIAENLVGKFQIAPFLSILEDYNSETSKAISLTKTAQGATTEAYERNATLNKTLSALLNEVQVSAQEVSKALGNIGVKDNFKKVLDVISSALDGITKALDKDTGNKALINTLKGIGDVLTGTAIPIAVAIILKLFGNLVIFGGKALITFFGINKAAQEHAAMQGQIAQSLLTNETVQKAILAIENDQISAAEKKERQILYFTTALREQLGIMQTMQGIARTIAPGVVAGTKPSKRGEFLRRTTPSFAGGYGGEMRDIDRGVGGAPSNAQPVNIPNFNFGGGMVGPVVANDSEYIVPNFGGSGGSAIFNQDMAESMGLPAGAQPINAAGGKTPKRREIKGDINERYLGKGKGNVSRDGRYAMIIPKNMGVEEKRGFLKDGTGFKFGVYGFNKAQFKGSEEKDIKEMVTKSAREILNNEANLFKGTKGGISAPKGDFKNAQFNSGAIGGMAGTIFEQTYKALTKQIKGLTTTQNDRFDFMGQEEVGGLKPFFPGLQNQARFVDAKINAEPDQLNSMAQKMKFFGAGNKNVSSKGAQTLTRSYTGPVPAGTNPNAQIGKVLDVSMPSAKQAKHRKGSPFASRGYIPNFSSGLIPNYGSGKSVGDHQGDLPPGWSMGPRGKSGMWIKDPKGDFAKPEAAAKAQKEHTAELKKATKEQKKNTQGNSSAYLAIMGVQAGLTMLGGSLQDSETKLGMFAKRLGEGGANIANAAFAWTAMKDLGSEAEGWKGKLGKFAGRLGQAAAAVSAVVSVWKMAKGMWQDLSGTSARLKDGLAVLNDAAIAAGASLDSLTGVEKLEVKKSAADIIDSTTVQAMINKVVGHSVGGTMGGAVIREWGMADVKVKIQDVEQDGKPLEEHIAHQIELALASGKTVESVRKAFKEAAKEGKKGTVLETDDIMAFAKKLKLFTKEALADAVREVNFFKTFKEEGLQGVLDKAQGIAGEFDATPKEVQAAIAADILKRGEKASQGRIETERVSKFLVVQRVKKLIEIENLNKRNVILAGLELSKRENSLRATKEELVQLGFKRDVLEAESSFRNQVLTTSGEILAKSKLLTKESADQIALEKAIKKANEDQVITLSEEREIMAATNQLLKGNTQMIDAEVTTLLDSLDIAREKNRLKIEELNIARLLAIQQEKILQKEKEDLALQRDRVNVPFKSRQQQRQDEISRIGQESAGLGQGPESILQKEATARSQSQLNINKIIEENAKAQEALFQGEKNKAAQLLSQGNIGLTPSDAAKKVGGAANLNELAGIMREADTVTEYSTNRVTGERIETVVRKNEEAIQEFVGNVTSAAAKLAASGGSTLKFAQISQEATGRMGEVLSELQIIEDIATNLRRGLNQANVRARLDIDPATRAKGLMVAGNRLAKADALDPDVGGGRDETLYRQILERELLAGKLIDASTQFAQNIGAAMIDAIAKGESLGDTLRQAATDFFYKMSQAFMDNAVNNIIGGGPGGSGFFGGVGKAFGMNSGGPIQGGSGSRDDVPALLTGGEFVMNKKAVQNYGSGFMGALNAGSVPKYANGGLFTPGTYGQGSIKGSSDLLRFATQSYTGGLQDSFVSGAGVAGLALEPQSGRLTTFGRKNSPAFQREQESKRKAFDLFSQQYSKNQDEKKRKEESKGSLMGSILGFGASAAFSTLLGGGLKNLFSSKKSATGGAIPYSAGIDSVPAMLSGGEFVMNAAATQNIGAGNLATLNAGGGTGGESGNQIVGKLDELNETLASSNTEINITVNSDGTENSDATNAPEQQRGLAVKIKDVVRQVIEDEKRLGGSLRMA